MDQTLKQSLGTWRHARTLSFLAVIASGVIFPWNHWVGFLTLSSAAFINMLLAGREYVIVGLYQIQTITKLRERLMYFGDNEYILRDILKDQLWRGETPDPEVIERLKKYELENEDFKNKVMELANKMFGDFGINKHTDADLDEAAGIAHKKESN